jgi:hypothetical protein
VNGSQNGDIEFRGGEIVMEMRLSEDATGGGGRSFVFSFYKKQ